MSLFENGEYRWRETYFVLFEEKHRPTTAAAQAALQRLGTKFEVTDLLENGGGYFESLTLVSPYDFAAMDISYVAGEDVTTQVTELKQELKHATLTEKELAQLQRLTTCDARFDIYHFQKISDGEDDDEEFMDPGTLLLVLEKFTRLCQGVGVDPQSGTLI